jgi:hypothetical protein
MILNTKRVVLLLAEGTVAVTAIAETLKESEHYRCLQHTDLDAARPTIAIVRPDFVIADVPYIEKSDELVAYIRDHISAIREVPGAGARAHPEGLHAGGL